LTLGSLFHSLVKKWHGLIWHIPQKSQRQMYAVWCDPTPGKREALEDLADFCHGLLQNRGQWNGNKGTYHHCTEGV